MCGRGRASGLPFPLGYAAGANICRTYTSPSPSPSSRVHLLFMLYTCLTHIYRHSPLQSLDHFPIYVTVYDCRKPRVSHASPGYPWLNQYSFRTFLRRLGLTRLRFLKRWHSSWIPPFRQDRERLKNIRGNTKNLFHNDVKRRKQLYVTQSLPGPLSFAEPIKLWVTSDFSRLTPCSAFLI